MSSSFTITPLGYKVHHVSSGGDATGSLAVCLHGLGGSIDTFTPLLSLLPPSLHVVRVDFPGFGESPLAPAPRHISVEDLVSSLHYLITTTLQKSPEQPFYILGHSLGGIVALQYAARYNEEAAPGTASGLFLLGPGRARAHIPAARQAMLSIAAKVRQDGIASAAENAGRSNFYEDTPERTANPALRKAVQDAVAASDPEGYAQACEALVDTAHVDPDYGWIKCPVVFVAGDKDIISPVAQSESLTKLVGGWATVEIVKSGHQPILEDPTGVAKAFGVFWDKVKGI